MRACVWRSQSRRASTRRPCPANSQYPAQHWPDVSYRPSSTRSNSHLRCGHIEDVERLSDYRPGGYHPVRVGDRFQQRYRVVHKLGHGTYSTAWLALDQQKSRYVAIKVGTTDSDIREVEMLSQLTKSVAASHRPLVQASLIPITLDSFSLRGPNGKHPCLVTVAARCNLAEVKEASDSGLFQLDVARSLAAQLAMAVSFIHSHGYAHGDLHLGNLLLQFPSSLNSMSVEQFYAKFGAPELEPIVRLDGKPTSSDPGVPSHAIPAVWLGAPSEHIALDEAKLLLSDFGTAFRPCDKNRVESYTPLALRPPEAFFEPSTPLSFASDIWSLACIIFELLAHRSLIDGIITPQDEITAQQIHLQGPLPSDWWDKYEKRQKWFDDAGKPISKQNDIWSWDRRFEQWIQAGRRRNGMEVIAEDEKAALFEMLRLMLAWMPSQRPSAEEVLRMPWMKKWALPAYVQSRTAWS